MKFQRAILTSFLLACLSLLVSQAALAAPVGKAKMVIGKVIVQTQGGKSIRLRRGNPISVGDIVITNDRSQAQLTMIDGSNISVRPDSKFQIETFVATGRVEEDKTHYMLIKGGFRSVTGSIGKKNKESFKLKTPVATMGIRGTDFVGKYCNSDCPASAGKNGLFVDVVSGGVALANKAGTFNLTPETNGFVGSPDEKPGRIDKLPENLLSPKARNTSRGKSGKKKYPSPEEELVQIGVYVAPDLKKEIIDEAMAAGMPTAEIINGAHSAGLQPEEILPDIISIGKRHGKSPTDLVQPILDSDIKSDNIIKDLMSQYPDSATDIMTAAIATGQVNPDQLKASARDMGINMQELEAAEAIGNMLAIPEEMQEILDGGNQGNGVSDDAAGRIRSRELTPDSAVQDVASPS